MGGRLVVLRRPPPGWRAWRDRSLVEVCAFQWRAAHRATVDAVTSMALDCHRIAFEDVVGPPERRLPALRGLARWLGADEAAMVSAGSGTLPVVMPTAPPAPGRWRQRAALLAPVLADAETLDLAAALGYGREPAPWR